MTTKLEQAARQALGALVRAEAMYGQPNADIQTALREALAEQAEQEPYYFGLTHDHTWLSIDKKQYDKLKPEGRMVCYTAPVRTKDLTDDEIWKANKTEIPDCQDLVDFARAVIAADRRKNK